MNPPPNLPRFVVCVGNSGWDDLELRKLSRVLPDPEASADGLLRVVDESGEDFLYPASCFLAASFAEDAAGVLEALVPSTAPA